MITKQNQQKCPRQNCKGKAIIDRTFGVLPCEKCQKEDEDFQVANPAEFNNLSKAQRVQEQRDKHGIDTIQPWLPGKDQKPNPDFVRTYPDAAKNYFSSEELSKM